MGSTDGACPKENVRVKPSDCLIHPPIKQRQVDCFTGQCGPVAAEIDKGETVSFQQPDRNILIACSDQDLVAIFAHWPDEVFKKVHMCWVIDIHYYLHFLPSKTLYFTRYAQRRSYSTLYKWKAAAFVATLSPFDRRSHSGS